MGLWAWSLAWLMVGAPGDDLVVVRNPAVELSWQSAPVPRLVGLTHRGSGTALLAATPARLFTLTLGNAAGGTMSIGADQASEGTLRSAPDGEATRLTVVYAGFPLAGLEVTVSVVVPPTGPLTSWALSLRSPTPLALREVVFPQVVAVPEIGQAADDVLVLPALPGVLIRNPAQSWPARFSTRVSYPGDMSAQFLAYQDAAAGVFLASQDAAGHPRRLGVEKRPDGYALDHAYQLEAGDRTTWSTPYPCVLGVTQGAWQDSADLYKTWAVQQPWCRQRLSERADVPAWVKAGPLVHVCSVRTYGADGLENGSYYPRLAAHVAELRRRVDGEVVLMLANWERDRRWSAGPYFPIFDEATARPVLAELRQQGVRPFVFLSGLYWTFDNEGQNGNQPAVPDALRPAFVTDPQTGQLKVDVLKADHDTTIWRRHSYQFCVSQPATTAWLCNVLDQAHALGIDLVQLDQTTSGAGAACGDPGHGHPVGPGRYQTAEFQRLLGAARQHGRELSPDFALLHEEPHEELIPYIDCFHVREYKERWWYRGRPGAVGIPLFDYLYHEYALGYGGDSATMTAQPNAFAVRVFAVNLVTGRTPGLSVWSTQERIKDGDAAQWTMLRHHTRLLQRGGAPFLMLGRMLHPLPLAVPETTYSLPVQRDGKWVMEPFVEPAVLTSSWQAPDGRVLHLFVNPTHQAVPVDVRLDTRQAGDWPRAELTIYSAAAGERFEPAGIVSLPHRLQRELAPLEVLAVTLQAAR